MRLVLAALAISLVTASAHAETVRTHYAPQVGQHSEIRITKCSDAQQGQQAPTHQCGVFVYDEEVVARTAEGLHLRYVATRVEGAGAEAALAMLRRLVLDLDTDESGVPLRIENRQQFLQTLRQTLPQDDTAAIDSTMHLFEQMDDAMLARALAKDFVSLSNFQGIDAEVGEERTQAVQMPFPLMQSEILTGTVTFALDSVDRTAGVVNAHLETRYDDASIAQAIQAFQASVLAQRNEPAPTEPMTFRMTDRMDGVVDLASGATRSIRSVRSMDAAQGANTIRRTDTMEIVRSPAPH